MVRTKVFVGNLSFKTGEKDLAKEFEVAGKVASANIISRGSRSLGYGFVEMESEEEARKAVELLNRKLIDSREINVEVARPREENTNGSNNPEGGARRRPTGPRRFFRRRAEPVPQQEGGAPVQQAAGGSPNSPNAALKAQGNNNNGGGRGAPRAPRRGGRFPRGGRGGGAPRGDRPVKVAPPNSVFVANLPFKLDDDSLASVFTKLTLKEPVKASHVVKDRLGFSKGFGFVEFANADDQQKALTADKTLVEAREIIVKAAFTEPPAPRNNSPAPAPVNEVEVKA